MHLTIFLECFDFDFFMCVCVTKFCSLARPCLKLRWSSHLCSWSSLDCRCAHCTWFVSVHCGYQYVYVFYVKLSIVFFSRSPCFSSHHFSFQIFNTIISTVSKSFVTAVQQPFLQAQLTPSLMEPLCSDSHFPICPRKVSSFSRGDSRPVCLLSITATKFLR